MPSLMNSCRQWIWRGFIRMALLAMPRRRLGGFELYSLADPADLEVLAERVGRALALIAAFDPGRLRRVERDLRRFGIEAVGGDRYDPGFRAHVLSKDWLQTSNDTDVALNIVHEATHARIFGRGIPYNARTAERIEAVCVGQEVAFARRLPGDQGWIRNLERKVERQWWKPGAQRARLAARLEALDAPEWVRRFLLKLLPDHPVDRDPP